MVDNKAVIGINLGHSYGSIAVINKDGHADCIANEDGERQLATAISYNGDQVYLGNQAKPQLVRNAANTINFFRNLLGRSYSELSDSEKERSSSKVIDVNGVPSFKVEIDGKETVLSAHDVAVRYLRSLLGSAQDFLSGVPIAGAVLGVPLWFSAKQMDAVCAAAKEAGIEVLQLIPEPIAAVVAYGLTSPRGPGRLPAHPDGAEGPAYQAGAELDRNVLVLDMGGTSTDITLLSAREGLYAPLAFVHDPALGGRALDDALVQHFAKEFTKKTKIEITPDNARAWAKLRNEAEVTKRALSASNSAQCSVESLAEGIDFSGSVNRMRLDILGGTVYGKVQQRVEEVLQEAGIEACQVDEVVLAGGASRLPGLTERLYALFPEEGPTRITASIDSDQVLARGSALHAQAVAALPEDSAERKHILSLPNAPPKEIAELKTPATTRALGLVLPAPSAAANGDAGDDVEKRVIDGTLFVPIVHAHTPLPARRVVELPVAAKASSVLLSFAEAKSEVRVDKIDPPALDSEDEDDEPLEPEEVRSARFRADSSRLVELALEVSGSNNVRVEVVLDKTGAVQITASQLGSEAKAVKASLPAPK